MITYSACGCNRSDSFFVPTTISVAITLDKSWYFPPTISPVRNDHRQLVTVSYLVVLSLRNNKGLVVPYFLDKASPAHPMGWASIEEAPAQANRLTVPLCTFVSA